MKYSLDAEGYFGRIEDLPGIWANGDTLEACRDELQEVLEEWIIVGLKMGHAIPAIDGIGLEAREGAKPVPRYRGGHKENALDC